MGAAYYHSRDGGRTRRVVEAREPASRRSSLSKAGRDRRGVSPFAAPIKQPIIGDKCRW
jgi:hypothetical protein